MSFIMIFLERINIKKTKQFFNRHQIDKLKTLKFLKGFHGQDIF
jgi:hypothetical protein